MDTSNFNPADARLVADITGLERLKTQAREDQSSAIGEVARQFESLLVDMMVKSMRQASLGEGILDSSQSLFYRDMYDQQMASQLAERGIGLTEVIERQLGGNALPSVAPGRGLEDYLGARVRNAPNTAPRPLTDSGSEPVLDSPRRFVERLMPQAREAADQLGIAPEALLAQAALETGWGRSVIHGSGGGNSHNLFGIKADGRWDGDRASVSTLEFIDGVAVQRRDPFRAYGSYGESFQDYVDFLQGSARYQRALESSDDPRTYFSALQEAGYATDPHYADKVMRVLEGPEMRAALERLDPIADTGSGTRPTSDG